MFYNGFMENNFQSVENELILSLKNMWGEDFNESYIQKPFRASLFLISLGLFKNNLTQKHFDMAAVFEKIHLAALIQDKIADRADKGHNRLAILVGDYVLAEVLTFLLDNVDRDLSGLIIETIQAMCEGGILKVKSECSSHISEEDYLELIGKTVACLTSLCCNTGAKIGGAEGDRILLMKDYGYLVGMAFQIMEDIIDNFEQKENTKFSLNLPFIYTLHKSGNKDKKYLLDLYNVHSKEIKVIINKYDGFNYAFNKASSFIEKAHSLLSVQEDSRAKDLLFKIEKEILTGSWWNKERICIPS